MVDNIISSLGAGSGIDTVKLVDDLIEIEQAPVSERLDSRQSKLQTQLSGYGVLRNAISSLQDSLDLLKDPDTFNAKTVAFPTTDILTPVEIDANALTGDYQIEVKEVAQAHSLTSTTFASTSSEVGMGTLTFNLGTWDDGLGGEGFSQFTVDPNTAETTITIDASNNTLSGLRDAINDADFGAQASIVAVGNEYRLLITAPSGASNELQITVAEDDVSPTNNDANGLSRFAFNLDGSQLTSNQSGNDSLMEVNGFEVSRSSNQITDVVEGLEFTLNKASVGEVVSFSISGDSSTAEDSIRGFVDAYNEFLTTVKDLVTTSDDESEDSSAGSLSTDPSAKSILNKVRSVISGSIEGADSAFNALAFVGITTELDGSLSIDEDNFSSAMGDKYELVTQLFTPSASSSNSLITVAQYKDSTLPGTFDVNITTQPSKGDFTSDTIVNNGVAFDYVSGGTFATTFTPSSPDYDFVINVNGTDSEVLTLSGSFDTLEEVRDQLQVMLNGDANLTSAGQSVSVVIDGDTLKFESGQYGSSSTVSFSVQGTGITNLGFGDAQGVSTTGTNVAGTINGEEGFGSGNVLLPAYGSDLTGLSLRITPGATSGSVTYSRGLGAELNNLLDEYLSTNGLISDREERINTQLEGIDEDRDTLSDRMERRRAMLEAQFIQMEAILASLSTTTSSLDGLIDRLPFTTSNN